MAISVIPSQYRPGFAKIRQLSESEYESIVNALERAPVVGGLKELTSAVVQQVPSLKRQDIEHMIRSLFSLCIFLTDEESLLAENLSALTSVMQSTGRPELTLTEEEKPVFERRLERLLRIPVVATSAKVQRLRFEYPNVFSDAKIMTDMRPIFEQPENRPIGCALSHTLKLTYHDRAGEHKDIYLALDAGDLEILKKAIKRAETKSATLKSFLGVAGLPDLS